MQIWGKAHTVHHTTPLVNKVPRASYPDFPVPNSNPPITLSFHARKVLPITRIEANLLFQTAATGIAAPSFRKGIVPNSSTGSRSDPSPYDWAIDYLRLLISNEGNNPLFTDVEALQIVQGLSTWAQAQTRQITLQYITAQQNGAFLGVVAVEIARGPATASTSNE